MGELKKGNLAGACAIVLWSMLALFTVTTGAIPPFQLTSMTFFIAFCLALLYRRVTTKQFLLSHALPLKVWVVGIYGLFGYHFCYFLALKSAPALEANLINYLWPLLIVLLSALLPQERLRWFHSVGALCGFAGALLLIGSKGVSFSSEYAQGYVFALLCAFLWSSYSVLSRYFGEVPTSAVGDFCGMTALCALVAHMVFETMYVPTTTELLAVIGLGIGPMGIAFFVWDYGMKKGDIKFIGALSYATPLLSTLLLVISGKSEPHAMIWVACGLIILGSLISSLGLKRS
jgi:drug/metabolite transporter (DMT)-like permease